MRPQTEHTNIHAFKHTYIQTFIHSNIQTDIHTYIHPYTHPSMYPYIATRPQTEATQRADGGGEDGDVEHANGALPSGTSVRHMMLI